MDLSNSNTAKNLEAAFGGESMANRKYLFFAEVTKKLGMSELSKLFKETANQETEHAFAHFRLLHPELVVGDMSSLTEEQKKAIASRCLELAIEGETYEYTTMYPNFAADARRDRMVLRLQNLNSKRQNLANTPLFFAKQQATSVS
ncbi:MAG: hypothetical protein HC784_15795 [Hydrococcus sp. CSU_1_8]|nr:hypothetical protein [Hydrococcus sp. CSU_1_8]